MDGAEELLAGLTLGHIKIGPEAAPLVFRVAAAGDPVARGLVVWAGRELGDLAVGIIRQLAFESERFDLVMAGSFFKGSRVIADSLGETVRAVAPGARLAPEDFAPTREEERRR